MAATSQALWAAYPVRKTAAKAMPQTTANENHATNQEI
jgi:hypothetical protein